MTTDVSQPLESVRSTFGEKPFVNIAAYQFVVLDDLKRRREELRSVCIHLQLKGTILLTPEGINMFIAGTRETINELLIFLREDAAFEDLEVKESLSEEQPFERMLVKIKEEIISFGVEGINPLEYTSKRLPAKQLKEWLDSGKEVLLLDTRNDYEVRVGTFKNAVPIGVDHFRDFPEAVERLPEETKDLPVVTFCTGGIRCEKAGPFMEQAGFRDIYQLEGGILKYFEECGGDHYDGECFVFDKRVALDSNLNETDTTQCYACLEPLTVEDQKSEFYDPPHACPHCHETPEEKQRQLQQKRDGKLKAVTTPLPGSAPYDNVRPLNVLEKFDQMTLLEFLVGRHPHLGEDHWKSECEKGHIRRNGKPVAADRIVRAGYQFAHLEPATTEPDVNANITILHEDDALVVVNKPAPLPTHPSGRFNRNSLQWIMNKVYHPLRLRPAHRLDANTTGIVVFCKSRAISHELQPQFKNETVGKVYLARVQGTVEWETQVCQARISRDAVERGGRVIDEEDGLSAETQFERLQTFADGTTLLRVVPKTGRTNQIRVHLWHLGFPVVGDPLYLPERQLGDTQTREIGEPMCLHALELSLTHPQSRELVKFFTPPPAWAELS